MARVASGAAPLVLLLLCLNVLSPGKQPTGRNPGGDECVVVGAAVELGCSVWCPIEAKKSTASAFIIQHPLGQRPPRLRVSSFPRRNRRCLQDRVVL